ncbi:2Fe-2S iron-sulfur cluster-binding protein, partial [Rhizobium johnstonii]|uniref:2Fe-2S iron-sulfur cluster-binding protein n=1 Tax=Rhizobium johnstonii TaxID=3019933 RepID=UPI003F9963E3
GLFCVMGVCHDFLVTIDGKVSQRSCMTTVDNDMQVLRPASRPDLATGQIADLCGVPQSLTTSTMDILKRRTSDRNRPPASSWRRP